MCPFARAGGGGKDRGKQCPAGDACSFAHNVFERYLHPDKYRTQLCVEGAGCRRKVCAEKASREGADRASKAGPARGARVQHANVHGSGSNAEQRAQC
jgi:hypothetical protein